MADEAKKVDKPRPQNVCLQGQGSTNQRRAVWGAMTPVAHPKSVPMSLFPPLFKQEQLAQMKRSYQEESQIYGTCSRPAEAVDQDRQDRHDQATKKDDEIEVLLRMLRDARAQAEFLRKRNELLVEEIAKYERMMADLQFRTPESRDTEEQRTREKQR